MKRIRFGFVFALLGIPLLVAVADRAWSGGPVLDIRTDGVYASYQYSEPIYTEGMGSFGPFLNYIGTRDAYVYVTEAEGMSSAGTYHYFNLSFELYVSTTYGFGYMRGNGQIPTGCLSFDQPKNQNLTLTVDTSDPSLSLYTYTYGDIPIEPPYINLRWDRLNQDWYRWEGHRVQKAEGFVIHSKGSGVENGAAITGGVFPLPDPNLPPDLSYFFGTPYFSARLGTQKARDKIIPLGPVS